MRDNYGLVKQMVIIAFEKGLTAPDASKNFNISVNSIYRAAKRMQIKLNKRKKTKHGSVV